MPKYEFDCPTHNEIEVYTGCTYNCVYCIAKSKHSDVVTVREDIDITLAKLKSGDFPEQPFYLSPWTDAYQDREEESLKTRTMLEELASDNKPFFVTTKGTLVRRDLDLFRNRENSFISCSLISLNDEIIKLLEPNAPLASERKKLIEELAKDPEIRVVVKIDPILPGITDGENLEELIDWLNDIQPTAVTVETARYDTKLVKRMQRHLPAEMFNKMIRYYPPIGELPVHPNIEYRTKLFNHVNARLKNASIEASFCTASLPDAINQNDCRGGYNNI
jgi:DNA repair photolyase